MAIKMLKCGKCNLVCTCFVWCIWQNA